MGQKRRVVVLFVFILVIALLGVGVWLHGPIILDAPEQFQGTTPQASFDYTHHPSNETLAVTHAGGTEFDRNTARRLELYVTKSETPAVTEVRPTETVSLPFRTGETVTVSNVERGDVVYLIWRESERSKGAGTIIDEHTVGGDPR